MANTPKARARAAPAGVKEWLPLARRHDRDPPVFKSGLQVERGYAAGPVPFPGCQLADDWDWRRLLRQCAAGTPLDRELRRLLKREGFVAEVVPAMNACMQVPL